MKYSELISFHPIEDVIQLTSANDADRAREYVRTYVMSDRMAANLKTLVIDQLQMDETANNKGVLIVGNYGTGKSHLMSMISAVANDDTCLAELTNQNFAEDAKRIAGKFEVLRFELTGVTMPLREIVLGFIEDDFHARGIPFETPDFSKVKDNKKLLQDVCQAFSFVYPDKGYLIVVDELLNFLVSRSAQQLALDLEFLRVLGEMCSKSRLRCMFGMQEKLFDNPKFGFVADTLGHVRDRITELVIAKEDTSYVVSERILKKTPEQKELIRRHLEKFAPLYAGMANRMDEFVELFPIHPAYVDILNKVYLIENRHILKNISVTIREIFDQELPEDAPGILSFDEYWPKIKQTPMLRTNPEVRRVLEASEKLENILEHAFPKPAYKPLAIKIIYALSVHRLTTNGLDVRFGLTAENLKDDLCLYLPMPEQDADFLLGVIKATLRDIMATVSGQFIIFNEANSQYFLDVDKVVDYDEKVKQRSSLLSDDDLNRYYYQVIYSCLGWDAKQYVPNFEIYEKDLNWESHGIFREGYLFMGLPAERSTAQPERDFYLLFMPPFGADSAQAANLADEVYFYFKADREFRDALQLFSAASALADLSEGKDKNAYLTRAALAQKKLVKYLSDNKTTCMEAAYLGRRRPLYKVLKGRNAREMDFSETIDLAASLCLDTYFESRYPEFPVFRTKITRRNMAENVRQAFDYFAGRKTAQGAAMLESFHLLDGERICPEKSGYAAYFIDLLKGLPPLGVINYEELFEPVFPETYEDRHFHIPCMFTPIVFLSLVYGGFATMTLKDGRIITAENLDQIPKVLGVDLYEFTCLSKPAQMAMRELKRLFELLGIDPQLLDSPDSQEELIRQFLDKTKEQCDLAVHAREKVQQRFELWGEPLVCESLLLRMRDSCLRVRDEFSNYAVKYNTSAKLNNFRLSLEQVEELGRQMDLVKLVSEYDRFRRECAAIVLYMTSIEGLDLGTDLSEELKAARASFVTIRDGIARGKSGESAAREVTALLERVRDKYIARYLEEHQKKRLDEDGERQRDALLKSPVLASLRRLRVIEILSGTKELAIEQELMELKPCSHLTAAELENNPFCTHCGYRLGDQVKDAAGQLKDLERRMKELLNEWTDTLLNTISDPLVAGQMEYLDWRQKAEMEAFLASGKLPETVDDHFVQSVKTLLQGFEPVVIDPEELVRRLQGAGPCEVGVFKSRFNAIIDACTRGKDLRKLRIILKTR